MKIVGVLLTILLALNAIASAELNASHLVEANCNATFEDCNSQNSNQSSDNQKHDHEKCEVHCAHQYVILKIEFSSTLIPDNDSHRSSYSFALSQTILDGPFRPPLV